MTHESALHICCAISFKIIIFMIQQCTETWSLLHCEVVGYTQLFSEERTIVQFGPPCFEACVCVCYSTSHVRKRTAYKPYEVWNEISPPWQTFWQKGFKICAFTFKTCTDEMHTHTHTPHHTVKLKGEINEMSSFYS